MARLSILLALYQGAAHLQAQLDSYAAQDFADWDLIVSDDGSRDAGPEMVRRFSAAHPVRLVDGPRRGHAANFLHLLAIAGPDVAMVALSDQDDVWLPGKLARAVTALEGLEGPVLYSARTQVVGPALEPRGISPLFPRPFGFRNALIQNVAAGNTIVLNRAALDLAQAAVARLGAAGQEVIAHDWFLYQLISGAGGRVIRDAEPVLLYRQHGGNTIGDNRGLGPSLRRVGMLISGGFQHWNEVQVAALQATADLLTDEARGLLADYASTRKAGLAGRLAGLARLGLYRQQRLGTAVLWLAALIGRL